ncbi:MAG TPA: electron transport complex subunit RsxE [Actinobacteria bacterium]|jgi:electron transport complex protein RnfE|nr:electron transport complex subunit RsxE [Actinomycetota bacterium]
MIEKQERLTAKKFWLEFVKGIVITNPVFVLVLGLCPTLAVSNSLNNALGMSAGVIFVLLGSNIIISLLRKITPNLVRIPVFIVVIATFVTILSLVFEAYLPPLYESLGIYLPLIVVNCIILGRAEVFASKNSVVLSIADAFGVGFGFTISLIIISFFRELLGTGGLEVFGKQLFSVPVLTESPMSVFIMPPGAFIVMGLLLALFRMIGVLKNE